MGTQDTPATAENSIEMSAVFEDEWPSALSGLTHRRIRLTSVPPSTFEWASDQQLNVLVPPTLGGRAGNSHLTPYVTPQNFHRAPPVKDSFVAPRGFGRSRARTAIADVQIRSPTGGQPSLHRRPHWSPDPRQYVIVS
jgi:hypothetical protein